MSDAARKILFWFAAACLLIGLLYLFRHILFPFVLGMGIAYALDPAADRLVRWGVPRGAASAAILIGFFAAAVAAVILLVPLLQEQLIHLIKRAPEAIAWLRERAAPLIERVQGQISPESVGQLQDAAKSYVGEAAAWLGRVASNLWSGGLAVVNLLSLVVVTPIVAFYLLRDWDNLVARMDSWLPRNEAPVIRAQVREIDRMISEYARGVVSVCLILAAFYATLLTAIGLDYGLVVGLAAGLFSFIPFAGAASGFLLGVALAFVQFPDWLHIGLVAGTFVAGQLLESNFITPRLVGDRVGLHPVWVLFALFAGGVLFGFLGILLAVPAAAAIGVLARFALTRYLASPLYLGTGPGRGDK